MQVVLSMLVSASGCGLEMVVHGDASGRRPRGLRREGPVCGRKKGHASRRAWWVTGWAKNGLNFGLSK